ncbi:MAG: type II toxin-antitoxin system VapC family toxin [Nitriliruptoraceae bacterium]
MTLYVDTSALLKLYVDEPESAACEAFLDDDGDWVTAAHTLVEMRRNLARLLSGDALEDALVQFRLDWDGLRVIELDLAVCEAAAEVAERTGARSLDALHLAAAVAAGGPTMVTYDARLAAAASVLGLGSAAP